MKKLAKLIALTGGAIGLTAVVNHIIFRNADVKLQSEFESQVYKWRHGRINYVVAGSGEPVLMVHDISAGGSLFEWEEQIGRLAKSYRVYAIDLLGFGASAKPRISYSAYLYASLINDFASDVIGSPVNLAASSSSGALAVAACALRPELYNKLLLVSPTGIGTTDRPVTLCGLFARSLIVAPVLGTAVYNILSSRTILRRALDDACHTSGDALDKLYYSAHRGGAGNKYPTADRLASMLNVKLSVMAGSIDVPVRVVWGSANKSNPLSNFGALRRLNDSIELTVFEGSKALPHRGRPKKFCGLCKSFFG